MAAGCPGSGHPTHRCLLSCAAGARISEQFGPIGPRQTGFLQAPPSAGPDCGPSGEGAGEARDFAMAPPSSLFPRLPEGRAGASACRGVAEAGGPALGQPSLLAPRPTQAAGPASPPSPGFCEVGLTWQSLCGGLWALRCCCGGGGPTKPSPGSAAAGGALPFLSPQIPGGRPPAGTIRGP